MKPNLLLVRIDLHYDCTAVKKAFCNADIHVDEFHLFQDDLDNFDLSKYAVIDLRNCRGFQDDQPRFWKKLAELRRAALPYNATFITPEDLLNFFCAKAIYLKKLEQAGARLNPTIFLAPNDPDFSIATHVSARPYGVMLKPSTGARAWNVYRLKGNLNEPDVFSIIHATQNQGGEAHQVHTRKVNGNQLRSFFASYRHDYKETVLVQDFIPSREYCAVFLGNKYSHMVEKIADKKSENMGLAIRHDLFGAKIRVIENPAPELVRFAEDVVRINPSYFDRIDLPYFRLDIFEDISVEAQSRSLSERLTLNEVEVMTVHLYLEESKAIDHFVQVMKNVMVMRQLSGAEQGFVI